jgi:hypothetical protein
MKIKKAAIVIGPLLTKRKKKKCQCHDAMLRLLMMPSNIST